ncbi:MAG: SPOR domain-containing protein [Immundisolibacteraceae bacterium]|nr:SPOR domain-containing protein [Immundisolibacteraceae bacterium]
MLLVEPFVLAQIGPSKVDRPKKMPSSIVEIRTLEELSSPLPTISTLKKRVPSKPVRSLPKVIKQAAIQADRPKSIVQTQALQTKNFVEQPLGLDAELPVSKSAEDESVADIQKKVPRLAEKVAVKVAPSQCFRFGPLRSFSKVQATGDKLVKEFEIIKWGEVEEAYTEDRHWIVMAGARTSEQAKFLVKQLDDKGFRDHYLPLGPDEPHLVSLGIFKERDRAERHLKSLGAAGFGAELRARKLEFSRRWLTFETAASQSDLTGFVEELDSAAVLETCPGVVDA